MKQAVGTEVKISCRPMVFMYTKVMVDPYTSWIVDPTFTKSIRDQKYINKTACLKTAESYAETVLHYHYVRLMWLIFFWHIWYLARNRTSHLQALCKIAIWFSLVFSCRVYIIYIIYVSCKRWWLLSLGAGLTRVKSQIHVQYWRFAPILSHFSFH